MAHKLKEQTDYYKEKTEARQSICYIIMAHPIIIGGMHKS